MQQGQSNIKCEFSRSKYTHTHTQAQLTDGKPLGIFFEILLKRMDVFRSVN